MATSAYSYSNYKQAAPVNNAILDPLQGFDADIFVIDQATGNYILVGRFVSIQITIRNATEPYLELNQRQPRYLDGEMQIGWVMERGMLDSRVLQQTFGYQTLTRTVRFNRMPRFQITFRVDAPELSQVNNQSSNSVGQSNSNYATPFQTRKANGEIVLTFCKVDSLTIGATAGRSVIANRWEGMAEGIEQKSNDNENTKMNAGLVLGKGTDAAYAITNGNSVNKNLNPYSYDDSLLKNTQFSTDKGTTLLD